MNILEHATQMQTNGVNKSVLEDMMSYYNQGIKELMGANEYVNEYENATTPEKKAMYHELAMQEIDHACKFVKSGSQLFAVAGPNDPLPHVWSHLKKHLSDWKSTLEIRMSQK